MRRFCCFLLGDRAAVSGHLRDVRGDVVTRRQMDDDEREDRDRDDRKDGQHQSTGKVGQHVPIKTFEPLDATT